MTMVQTFFGNYAKALISFSAERISEFYRLPLMIYSDEGIQVVGEMPDVINFWREAVKPYKGQNIEETTPQLLSEEALSDTIFISKVLWKNYDGVGREVAHETNFYILSK